MNEADRRAFEAGPVEADSPVGSGLLPCGYVDEHGALHRDFIVGELTGLDEDILGDRSSVAITTRLSAVIGNCLVRLGTITGKAKLRSIAANLTTADREYLLIAIRRVSVGNTYKFTSECTRPRCNGMYKGQVDLSKLDITEMPEPLVRERTGVYGGATVKWHVTTGVDEGWLVSAMSRLSSADQNDPGSSASVTLQILARVDSINGVKLDRDGAGLDRSVQFLQSLPSRVRREIRFAFEGVEGGVDTRIEFACPKCGAEQVRPVPFTLDFFFPPVA